MAKTRLNTLASLLKGLIASVLLTLILMLILAVAAVYLKPGDTAIMWLNQFIKIVSIVFGVCVAVGRGGENGFVTGMALSIIYMILGYALYLTLGGNVFNVVSMLGEILVGAAVGSIAGAILANLQPKRPRKKR